MMDFPPAYLHMRPGTPFEDTFSRVETANGAMLVAVVNEREGKLVPLHMWPTIQPIRWV